MHIPANALINLLHQCSFGTLASHARQTGGYPYPTVLPFVTDNRHRPAILISRLAEHTRNLQADARAGFLVFDAPDGQVIEGPRLTLLGDCHPVADTPDAGGIARRYLRYHPDAERYLALGDFSFFSMTPLRLRYIGGFGAMGWLDGSTLDLTPPLADDEEVALLDEFGGPLPASVRLLGIDRHGVDLVRAGQRRRHAFNDPPLSDAEQQAASASEADADAIHHVLDFETLRLALRECVDELAREALT
ncbi:MAG: HugZ family protein [Janthinobacterium lividum]